MRKFSDHRVNPVRNSSGASNPAGTILGLNPAAELCTALNQNGSGHRMVYRVEQRSIISNGVNGESRGKR
jgi:hypothetical protein